MPDQQVCPNCYPAKMEPVTVGDNPAVGRIGWFCIGCDTFVPDGDYINIEEAPINAPL